MNSVQKKLLIGLTLFAIGAYGIYWFWTIDRHPYISLITYFASMSAAMGGGYITWKAVSQKRADGKSVTDITWSIVKIWVLPIVAFCTTLCVAFDEWLERDDSKK